jgi:hypothetical protein
VRSILTDYIPLLQYSRIIWEASTFPVAGKTETWVQHYGAGFAADKQPLSAELIPFTEGEVAYARNGINDTSVKAAEDYIIRQLSQNNDRQIRWSMMFLAKSKSYKDVPLLLKNLTYRYTTTPLADESYPAMKALALLGKPAADAALAQLSVEEQQQRLELLATVAVKVYGRSEGARRIEQVAETQTDIRRQRLLSAVAKVSR